LKKINRISEALAYCAADIFGKQNFEKKLSRNAMLAAFFSSPVIDIDDLGKALMILQSDGIKPVAQGFSLRLGKVFFHYSHRKYSDDIMNNSLEFRLLPFLERVEKALKLYFQWLKKDLKFNNSIARQKTGWKIQLEFPYKEKGHQLALYFFKGILLEFFDWLDCHYRYSVEFSDMVKGDLQQVCFDVFYFPLE
jgi:hypothetical protein